MGKRICAVSNCRNGQTHTSARNKKLGLKNKSLFNAPKLKILSLFLLGRKYVASMNADLKNLRKPFTENCFVCEDHFDEDIIRFDECQLKDGTMHRLRRGKPKLRETAVITKVLKQLVGREICESNQGSMNMHEENNYIRSSTSNNSMCNVDYLHQDHEPINPQLFTTINDMSTQFDFGIVLSS